MTTRGGTIEPDGRPVQAPGVGRDAKRHDLEGTPGLGKGSSLEQGDVQMLEAGKQVIKQAQAPAQAQGAAAPSAAAAAGPPMEVPDAIQFAGERLGGDTFGAGTTDGSVYDPAPWMPTLRVLSSQPNAGGGLTAAVVEMIASFRKQPSGTDQTFIDVNELDNTLR